MGEGLRVGRQVWAAWAWADRRLGHQESGLDPQVQVVPLAVPSLLATWVARLHQGHKVMVTAHHQALAALLHQEVSWAGLRHQVKRWSRSVQSARFLVLCL